ncbi:MAG: hypothetical protein A3E85_00465 [Gammaproteobacteria bacterium RIFCSPHIGHO2_12_FULL_45_12]|nr:MAG: hypothetical protein A3E85_00465 [Gammaproteobacteria bacterium RIFCSPHIGHO2_12_FULL_45_12]
MLKKWIVLVLSVSFILAACHSPLYNQTEGNVSDIKDKMVQARKKSNETAIKPASLLVNKGLYVDTTPISLEREPSWLQNHIVIRGDQLPFSYYSRTIASGAGSDVLTKYQPGLDSAERVSMSYSGTVKGALNLLASKSGYVYSVRNKKIEWLAFVTKTYDVAFMPGGTDYLMGNSGGGGSSSDAPGGNTGGQVANYVSADASGSEFSSLKGTLSVWTDLDTTIKQLLSPEGKAFVSQSSTSVTVRDRPTNVAMVGQYIANLNGKLSRQVLVKVQILDIKLNSAFNFGIDWGLIANAFNHSPFVLNANYGTPVTITPLTSQPGTQTTPIFGTQYNGAGIPGWTILFNALNQQGKTGVVSEPRVVCLNNQVSVIRIVSSEGYVASIQNTTLAGATSGSNNTVTSQVTPGTLITGLTLYILPKIMGEDVYLQINADLSVNDRFGQFGPTDAQIQLPNITEKHFNQRSKIRSGDTMILSGFRQVYNQTGANQLLNSQALGGQAALQANTETIILITPIILHGPA